jgi:hypothetical protein
LLNRFEDATVYQTWAYGAVRWGQSNLSHLVLKRNREVVAMAQLRIVRPRHFNCGIAYLTWGPLCQPKTEELDPETIGRLAKALYDEYVGKRRLYLRILPNAFVESRRGMLFRSGFSRYFNEQSGHATTYRTLVLGLDLSLDELRKRLDQKWRNQLNRAERNGLSIIEDDKTEHYQVFADIYKQMWDRKRFETTVDIKAFGRIQEALPKSQKLKVLICKHANVPVGGIVCSTMGTTAIYVLGATSDSGLKTKGAYLLQWTMIKWLKENGFHNYDLGGIDPEANPGVYHFKLGLSRQDLSRIPALEACVSALSSVSMKVADFVQCGMRGSFPKLIKWRIARLLRWRGRRSNNG